MDNRDNVNRKKIVFVIPSLEAGGMERVMTELLHHFAAQPALEVHLVLYGISRGIFYTLPEGITIHKPAFTFNNKYRSFNTLRTIFFLRKKIRSLQPFTVLSFGEYWNSFVLLSLKGTGIPVFVSDRCQPDKDLGKLHEFLRKWLYPGAAGIIVQTAAARDIYSRLIKHKNIAVIGNPVRAIKREKEVKENIVLTVGRLIKTKHHDEMIRVFARINQPGWKLVIAGGDALRQENMVRLKALVETLGVAGTVVLAGPVKEVEALYLQSRIFAFTSSSEGFPNVVGEALSAGLPVVAFDCVAGPSEMIRDEENGFLVPLFDYTTFEKQLRLLMTDENLRTRLSQNAAASVEKFSAPVISGRYMDFILQVKK